MSRYCPRHPTERMTLLLTSFVCDVCDPPRRAEPVKKVGTPRNDLQGFLLCPTCGERAKYAECDGLDPDVWRARCSLGHIWTPKEGLLVGDRTGPNSSGFYYTWVDYPTKYWVADES